METYLKVLIALSVLFFVWALIRKYGKNLREHTESHVESDGTCTQANYTGSEQRHVLETTPTSESFKPCAARGLSIDCKTNSESNGVTYSKWAHTQAECDILKASITGNGQ